MLADLLGDLFEDLIKFIFAKFCKKTENGTTQIKVGGKNNTQISK